MNTINLTITVINNRKFYNKVSFGIKFSIVSLHVISIKNCTVNAKVTVKLTNGKKLICNVSVKSNKYSGKKLTISDTTYNQYGLKAYSAHFDNKGNLVVKFMVANNSYGKLTKIPKLKITVKDSKKNVVASFKKNSYTINVNSYKSKSYTISIPKSSLKKNKDKIDVRTCTFTISGKDADAKL